MSEIERN
jgi:hypothetical protein